MGDWLATREAAMRQSFSQKFRLDDFVDENFPAYPIEMIGRGICEFCMSWTRRLYRFR
jgi:hypothetical protein